MYHSIFTTKNKKGKDADPNSREFESTAEAYWKTYARFPPIVLQYSGKSSKIGSGLSPITYFDKHMMHHEVY